MRVRGIRSTVTVSELAKHDPDIARLNPDQVYRPPVYVPFDPLTRLSASQQAALLWLFETMPARRCALKLKEIEQASFGTADFDALCKQGLAERPQGYRLHKITGLGRVAAKDLQTKLCQRFGIHIKQGGNSNLRGSNYYSCSCGQWSSYIERNIHSDNQSVWKFLKHCDEARKIAVLLCDSAERSA